MALKIRLHRSNNQEAYEKLDGAVTAALGGASAMVKWMQAEDWQDGSSQGKRPRSQSEFCFFRTPGEASTALPESSILVCTVGRI